MKVFIGADHRGYNLKEILKKWLYTKGYEVVDCGNSVYDKNDDFPDFTFAVTDKVVEDSGYRGVVICGSGGGVTIAANKVKGIRAAQAVNTDDVMHNRSHDDINVLAIGSDYVGETDAKLMTEAFLVTPFDSHDRLVRRLSKISSREK